MKNVTLGIDIGGTKIFYALVNPDGSIKGNVKKEQTPDSAERIRKLIKSILINYEKKVDRVGIATAGAVSIDNDRVISSTANLPFRYDKINFKTQNPKVKVFLQNDANAAAWAEHKIGAGAGCKNSIVLTLGTGLGGGIIVEDKLLRGKSGAAGEMHFKMSMDKKRECTCGSYDCFETYGSGRGLKLTYKDFTGEEISTYEIVDKAKNGEEKAILALKRWNEYIAEGILGLNNIFDTEVFALTGSMADFVDIEWVEEYVNKRTVATKTSVKLCRAGNYAGLVGAALLANELDK